MAPVRRTPTPLSARHLTTPRSPPTNQQRQTALEDRWPAARKRPPHICAAAKTTPRIHTSPGPARTLHAPPQPAAAATAQPKPRSGPHYGTESGGRTLAEALLLNTTVAPPNLSK